MCRITLRITYTSFIGNNFTPFREKQQRSKGAEERRRNESQKKLQIEN
jgi:hypothetical protein